MGFLGDYYLEIEAPSPGKRKVVFPRPIVDKWVKMGLDFEQELEDKEYYIGKISVKFSDEYYMFMMNKKSFVEKNHELSLETLFRQDEYQQLPVSFYAGSFDKRPYIFNHGWEETVNPTLLKKLNDKLINYLDEKPEIKMKYQQLLDDAKKVNIICELGIYFFVRLDVVAI